MTNKELFYFTGKCLTIDEHPGFREEILEKIASESIDWERFVALCSNHLILPLIYLKFQSRDILEYMPKELSEYLKEIYDLNVSRNNQILKQIQEVTDILNKSGIYPVYLKGAGNILDGLYSNIGERMMGDIDFLVPEKDYLISAKLLENEGYGMIEPFYGEDIEKLRHYPVLSKTDFPAHLEIHRLPVEEAFQSWFNPEMIYKEVKSVSSATGCYVLSDEHKIILNFIHSQLGHDGHLYGVVSFRDLYDLYLLSKRTEIAQTIPNIKSKQKEIVYFNFAGKALGLDWKFYPGSKLSFWLFSKKHDLNQSSKAFYYTHRTAIYILQRIYVGYAGQFIKSFYSKKMRQSVIHRLTSHQWYSAHLHSYKNFFSNNK